MGAWWGVHRYTNIVLEGLRSYNEVFQHKSCIKILLIVFKPHKPWTHVSRFRYMSYPVPQKICSRCEHFVASGTGKFRLALLHSVKMPRFVGSEIFSAFETFVSRFVFVFRRQMADEFVLAASSASPAVSSAAAAGAADAAALEVAFPTKNHFLVVMKRPHVSSERLSVRLFLTEESTVEHPNGEMIGVEVDVERSLGSRRVVAL